MNLNIVGDKLHIEFTLVEQLLAVRFRKLWKIPLAHIQQIFIATPQNAWNDIRFMGTYLPSKIKVGTYLTKRGKEFWYANKDKNYLVIELQNESYQRIILNVDQLKNI